MLMPVTPEGLTVQYRGRSERVPLASGGEGAILRRFQGAEVSLELMLPRVRYPFALYERGFMVPEQYLDKFTELRESRRPFLFVCVRYVEGGPMRRSNHYWASLEDMDICEEANHGRDSVVSLTFREVQIHHTRRAVFNSGQLGRNLNWMIPPGVRETVNRPDNRLELMRNRPELMRRG